MQEPLHEKILHQVWKPFFSLGHSNSRLSFDLRWYDEFCLMLTISLRKGGANPCITLKVKSKILKRIRKQTGNHAIMTIQSWCYVRIFSNVHYEPIVAAAFCTLWSLGICVRG